MDWSEVRKKFVSSACCVIFISSSPILIPCMPGSRLTKFANTSPSRAYKIIDRGQPCLTPLVRVKGSEKVPFILTCDFICVYRVFILLIKVSPYPKAFSVLKRNVQLTLSNAFAWSMDISAAGRASTAACWIRPLTALIFVSLCVQEH